MSFVDLSIVIPFRPGDPQRDRIFEWVNARWSNAAASLAKTVEFMVADSGDDEFDRGKSRNQGVARTTGDVVILADADVIPDFGLIAHALASLDDHPWALPYDVYMNVNREFTDLILDKVNSDRAVYLHGEGSCDHRITDSVAGLLVMPREAFEAVGGYDEKFQGWGYEDNAFALALDTLAGPHFRVPGELLHLWHPVPPDGAFNSPGIESNRKLYRRYKRAAGDRRRMGDLVGSVHATG